VIEVVMVMAGAMVGAPMRYLVDTWVTTHWRPRFEDRFPLGTFVVNMTGCLALGFVVGLDRTQGLTPEVASLLEVGMLGSYTTFSTYAWESYVLHKAGETSVVLVNVLGSALIGSALAATGLWLGGVPG
jgi:CrcB protein